MKKIVPATAIMSFLWVSAWATETRETIMPGSGGPGIEDYKLIGLLRKDMSGADVKLLVPAIRKMVSNEDGRTRSCIGHTGDRGPCRRRSGAVARRPDR